MPGFLSIWEAPSLSVTCGMMTPSGTSEWKFGVTCKAEPKNWTNGTAPTSLRKNANLSGGHPCKLWMIRLSSGCSPAPGGGAGAVAYA